MVSIIALALGAAALPAQSCQGAAPAVGVDPAAAFPRAVDGATLKTFKALDKLRRGSAGTLVIRGGDLSGQRVGKAQLANICFVDTKLQRTDWTGVQASGLGFLRSDLSGATLAGAKLPYVLLRESNLAGVNATGADMSLGRLDGGWGGSLAGLRLDGARMFGFQVVCGQREVDGCPFDRSNMSIRGADFTRANLATFSFWNTALEGAVLADTHVGVQQIGQLSSLVVKGPIIVHSPHRHVTLSPADYLALRGGVKLLTSAVQAREPARPVDPEACNALTDRRAHAICLGGPELQRLAEEAALAARATGSAGELAAQQDFCVNLSDDMIASCLTRTYRLTLAAQTRAAQASAAVAGPLSSSVIFAALPMRFSDEFRRTPLYTRVLPVLLDVAPTQIYALRSADGTLAVTGGSASGCQVAATGLSWLPTGWYGLETGPARRWRGRLYRPKPTPVLRFGAAGLELDPAARDRVLRCAPGGKLDPVMRLEGPPQFVSLIAEQWTASAAARSGQSSAAAAGGGS